MKNKLFAFGLFFIVLLSGSILFSDENHNELNSIGIEYKQLSSSYENSYILGNYIDAFNYSKKQLEIDPSDPIAYLRLSVAAQYIDVDKEELKKDYSPYISERDEDQKEIKALANTYLSAKHIKVKTGV